MDIKNIDLRLLRSFLAIYKAGTFVRASEYLSITQSALSQQMKELNGFFNQNLFEKKGRRLITSEFGKSLLERIEPLISQIDETLLQNLDESKSIAGALRIGATHSYSRALAVPVIMQLIAVNPQLRVDLQESSSQRLITDLMNGEIDLGILPQEYPYNEISQDHLLTEQLCVIGTSEKIQLLPKRLSLEKLQEYELALLNRQFLMRQQIELQARKDNLYLQVRLETSNSNDLIEVAKSGQLLTICSPMIALGENRLSFQPIHGEYLNRKCVLCWRKDRYVSAAMKAFQELSHVLCGKIHQEINCK